MVEKQKHREKAKKQRRGKCRKTKKKGNSFPKKILNGKIKKKTIPKQTSKNKTR